MVGGGAGADIGAVHQAAMRLDDRYSLDAGIFGRSPASSAARGAALGVAADRVYPDAVSMAAAEANRPDGIDVAVVATPNDTHYRMAKAFLEAGTSVVCEKPLTTEAATSAELVRLAAERGLVLAVAHCYSAYAMVRQAARMVRDGALGPVRFVDVEHASGWAAGDVESSGNPQAEWRTDPSVGGSLSVVADLGTHAYHLARYITGLDAVEVSAVLATLVPGRRVYDNATVTLRLASDAARDAVPGRLWACMAAAGHHHGLRIRVFCASGNLEWQHEDPHHLSVQWADGRHEILTQGQPGLSEDAARLTRAGLGHPEGFLEAFANFYSDVAEAVSARRDGSVPPERDLSFPTGTDGLMGLEFMAAVAASHRRGGAFVPAGHDAKGVA